MTITDEILKIETPYYMGDGKMINYQTAIQATAKAKEVCYHLATDAYGKGETDTQKELYKIIDGLQVQLEKLGEIENNAHCAQEKFNYKDLLT